jgi:hypothetical protein
MAPIIESRCPFLTVAASVSVSREVLGVASERWSDHPRLYNNVPCCFITSIVSSGQAPPGLSKTRAKAFSASDVVLGLPGLCCIGVDDSVIPLWEALFIFWHTWQSPTGRLAGSSKIQDSRGRVEGEVCGLGRIKRCSRGSE